MTESRSLVTVGWSVGKGRREHFEVTCLFIILTVVMIHKYIFMHKNIKWYTLTTFNLLCISYTSVIVLEEKIIFDLANNLLEPGTMAEVKRLVPCQVLFLKMISL